MLDFVTALWKIPAKTISGSHTDCKPRAPAIGLERFPQMLLGDSVKLEKLQSGRYGI
jgi:hypothetical protein